MPSQQEVAAPTPTGPTDDRDWRWAGVRDLEVQVPAEWGFAYDAVRPDCIDRETLRGSWARDVPRAPYVMVGTPPRGVPAIGCFPEQRPGDPPAVFGALPFRLWQPYVQLALARTDLDDPTYENGTWQHDGWTLTRTTVGDVQVAILGSPRDDGLAERVLESARSVETTHAGCDPDSPIQAEKFVEPDGAPVPPAAEVAAIAVCEYAREPGRAGLEGSRRITGQPARDLVAAVHRAPSPGGPDRPKSCVPDLYGDRAIALRFFGDTDQTTAPLAEAFVYYDSCFGNGIVATDGIRRLTRDNCAPLFDEAPILFWGGHAGVFKTCHTRSES